MTNFWRSPKPLLAVIYKILLRPLLFLLPPETAHSLVGTLLKLMKIFYPRDGKITPKKEFFGLSFPNTVGLAAGFDKNAKFIGTLGRLGFGFIEIGTVTPKPQAGNPKPRLFRLPKDEALVNRMGFNNDGVVKIATRLRRFRRKKRNIIIGANIGKNKETPNERAYEDYEKCFETLFDDADYFVVNVSSPNTPNLRDLQDRRYLVTILSRLMEFNKKRPKQKPILLKIAPDLTHEQLDEIIDVVKETRIDGIVATNTTTSREGLVTRRDEIVKMGAGGLSGKPIADRSTGVVRYLADKSGKAFPIIGVGGIHSPEEAVEKIRAGASLVQIYTGLIYEGPSLIKKIKRAIAKEDRAL